MTIATKHISRSTLKYLIMMLICFLSFGLTGQAVLLDNLDSLETERIQKRNNLKAKPNIQKEVDDKINEHRLLMMSYEWFGMPTFMEQKKLEKATNDRFNYYNTSLYNDYNTSNGVFYRTNHRRIKKTGFSAQKQPIVFGWHPFWNENTYKSYNYRMLTHVSFYGYELNPFTGGYFSYEAINQFLESELIENAHMDSCQVLLSLNSRTELNHEVFFTGESDIRQNLIDSLIQLLAISGADGIDINFDDVPLTYKSDFLAFVKEMSFQLREYNSDYTICMTVPTKDRSNVYDLYQLRSYVDFFVINGFSFHIKETELNEGPLAPFVSLDAEIRQSENLYQIYCTLDELMATPYDINQVVLSHEDKYVELLKDSLNLFIRRNYDNLEYKDYDITEVLNTIKITKDRNDRPLWMSPNILRLLKRTNAVGILSQKVKASKASEDNMFFIFEPKKDSLIFKEYEIFKNVSIRSNVDSNLYDIRRVVDEYKNRIGSDYHSSLVLALPYHGAVWYKDREGEKTFEGYLPYSKIIEMTENGQTSIVYDKGTSSLEATYRDTLGGLYKIYFDNSTSLSRKYDYVVDEKIGGVGIWSLGADYAHTNLWSTLEEKIVGRTKWDSELNKEVYITVESGNKVGFTIEYLMKRFSNLIFATLVFVVIFTFLAFGFTLLDWKIRDILFYSGAFRILYMVLFTVLVMVLGDVFGWFNNKAITFAIGTILGLLLTWYASNLVQKNHEKLP